MLNLLVDYRRPRSFSRVSGIPSDWNRSEYNRRRKAYATFAELVKNIRAKFLLISFNSDGFITSKEMRGLLENLGRVQVRAIKYNTFRGSRNLRKRSIHVEEYLYLVEKA